MTADLTEEVTWQIDAWDNPAGLKEVLATAAPAADCLAAIEASVDPVLQPGDRVVDLGCGYGRLAVPFAARHPQQRVIGVDVGPTLIWFAGINIPYGVGNLRYAVCDGTSLPASVAPVGAVYSITVFQHLPLAMVAGYVGSVAAALRPGGVFRFQYVTGDFHCPLRHGYSAKEITETVAEHGLIVDAVDRGVIYPEWTFITARKPR